jgi:hypothetical protein
VRARGVERVEDDVLVVSIDRLPAALRSTAGTRTRPAFLSGGERLSSPARKLASAFGDTLAPP